MPFIKLKDETQLYYKDWGTGKPVIFVHGWCLHSDSMEYLMNELCENGFRCIAYDQRGCGRSDQAWSGYDIDGLASDLDTVIQHFGLDEITLVGHSVGCAVICNYLAKYQPTCISKAILNSTTTPFVLKDESNPEGIDESFLINSIDFTKNDKPAYIRSLAEAFFDLGSEDCLVSSEMTNWAVGITQAATLKAAIELLRASFLTDLRSELPKIKIPILLQHGDRDVNSPYYLTAEKSHALLPDSRLVVYPAHAHGLHISGWQPVSADMIAFINSK